MLIHEPGICVNDPIFKPSRQSGLERETTGATLRPFIELKVVRQ